MKAMEGAAAGLPAPPDFLFVDGNRLPKVGVGGRRWRSAGGSRAGARSVRTRAHKLLCRRRRTRAPCDCLQGFDPSRAAAVVKGDSKSVCIAAASVIAKVTRDRLMLALHAQYPAYNFGGGRGRVCVELGVGGGRGGQRAC